jgi:hypothetical protein
MNEEQVQQGRNALLELGWEAGSISEFCRLTCERDVKKQIANGITPYLKKTSLDLNQLLKEFDSLIDHIEDFNNG